MHDDGAGPSSVTLVHLPVEEMREGEECEREINRSDKKRRGSKKGVSVMDLLLQPHQSMIIFVTMQLDPDY